MFKRLMNYNNYKKILLIIAGVILGIIILLAIPKSKADFDSIVARFYILIQQYDKGISILDDNPSHSNNFERIISAKYQKGKKYYKKEDYYNSQLTFNEILSYKDSKIWYDDSVYQIGKIYYSNGLYRDALNYFEKIEDYSDSYVYTMLCRDSLYNLQDFNDGVIPISQQVEVYKVFKQIAEYDDITRRLEDNKYILAKLVGTWVEKTEKNLNLSLLVNGDAVSLNHSLPLPSNIKSDGSLYIKENILGIGTTKADMVNIFRIESITDSEAKIFCYADGKTYTFVRE